MKLKDFPNSIPVFEGHWSQVSKKLTDIAETAEVSFKINSGWERQVYIIGLNTKETWPEDKSFLVWAKYKDKETGKPAHYLFTEIKSVLSYNPK